MTLLAGPIFDGTAHVNNIAAVGGSSHMAERGFLYIDDKSMISPPVSPTLKAEQ